MQRSANGIAWHSSGFTARMHKGFLLTIWKNFEDCYEKFSHFFHVLFSNFVDYVSIVVVEVKNSIMYCALHSSEVDRLII